MSRSLHPLTLVAFLAAAPALGACSLLAPSDEALMGPPLGSGAASTSSGSVGGGGGGGAGGQGAAGRCNKTTLIAESFDDGAIDARFAPEGDITESGGELVAFAPGAASYALMRTEHYYDLDDSEIRVRVTPDIDGTEEAFVSADYEASQDTWASLHLTEGMLRALRTELGARETLAEVAYDPEVHRVWRLRETGGTFFWETSADGDAFTVLAEAPIAQTFFVNRVTVGMGTWKNEGEGTATVRFDDLNGGTPSGVHCPIATLGDDFDNGVRDSIWARAEADGGKSSELGGALQLEPPAAPDSGYVYYLSASSYDMRVGAVAVETVAEPGATASTTMTLAVVAPDDVTDSVEVTLQVGELSCRLMEDGAESASTNLPFDAAAHRFWRLREEGGRIHCEVSADGAAWTSVGDAAPPFDVAAVDVLLGAATSIPERAPGTAAFDNLNRLP